MYYVLFYHKFLHGNSIPNLLSLSRARHDSWGSRDSRVTDVT
jgi:hypothetical protein